MDVRMELSRILISELGDQQVIFLKEVGGERSFPIVIGIAEALAIRRRLNGEATPRPMTHDLLAGVIRAMGGSLEKIVINDIRDHTFIAALYIRRGDETIQVDSRPSDAIALGAAFNTPIFVAEHVLESVLNESPTAQERIEMLRQRLEELSRRIEELAARLEDKEFLAETPATDVQEHRRRLREMKAEFEAIDRVLKKLG